MRGRLQIRGDRVTADQIYEATSPHEADAPSVDRPVNQKFGERLRSLRTSHRISEEQLADKLFMSADRVRLLEAGEASASIVELDALADVFSVSIAEMLRDI